VSACTRRNRSNTPVQALTLLNDEAFFECAQTLAARVLKEVPDRNETGSEPADASGTATVGSEVPVPLGADLITPRVRHMFRLCVAREPNDLEMRRLVELYQAELADGSAGATALLDKPAVAPDTSATDASSTANPNRELAAWTTVARVLLNLDETITRE